MVPSKVMLTFALASKPEPLTVTLVPWGPLSGVTENEDVTAKFPRGKPPAVTGYERAGTAGTVNGVENEPRGFAGPNGTSVPSKSKMTGWEGPKPSPLTVTCVPAGPLLVERVAREVTLNSA